MDDTENQRNRLFKPSEPPLDVDGKEVYRFLTSYYIHQNQLGWSRLQTVFFIEAGILAGFFSKTTSGNISVMGMVLGALVIWFLHQLVERDWLIRDQNNRFLDEFHENLNIKLRITPVHKWLRGKWIARYISYGCIVTDILLAMVRYFHIACI